MRRGGKLTQPVVDPEPGNPEPDEHVGPAEGVAKIHLESEVEEESDVAQNDKLGVLVVIDGAARVEMVDTTAETVMLALSAALTLALMEVVAGDVGDEVVGPANELLQEKHGEGEDGRLLSQLRDLVDEAANTAGVLLTGPGVENHVLLNVSSTLVVLAVGELPAEVGHKEGRVQEPAGRVVD